MDALWALGRRTEADALLAEAKAKQSETGALGIACTYARRNDKDQALQWLDRAYRNEEPTVTAMGIFSCFRDMHSDPRFAAMLRKIGLTS
jgi:hypothetical protein